VVVHSDVSFPTFYRSKNPTKNKNEGFIVSFAKHKSLKLGLSFECFVSQREGGLEARR